MNNHNDLILALSNIHENELLHVFLIPNQTALIVTRLIISNLDLKETDFLLIPLRRYLLDPKLFVLILLSQLKGFPQISFTNLKVSEGSLLTSKSTMYNFLIKYLYKNNNLIILYLFS